MTLMSAPPAVSWKRLELLGAGATSKVYRAYLRDKGLLLAAKRIELQRDLSASQSGRTALFAALRELETMQALPPNLHIIRLYGSQVEEEEEEEEGDWGKGVATNSGGGGSGIRGGGRASVAAAPAAAGAPPALPRRQYLTIFTELAVGGSLSSLVRRVGALTEPVARSFARQMLLGLESLHSHGVVHRDIKCANALISGEGGDIIKLGDFGNALKLINSPVTESAQRPVTAGGWCCSCLWDASSTAAPPSAPEGPQTREIVSPGDLKEKFAGTPHYMAPEVIMGLPTAGMASDIWALGCSVIEMLTGEQPWGACARWDPPYHLGPPP